MNLRKFTNSLPASRKHTIHLKLRKRWIGVPRTRWSRSFFNRHRSLEFPQFLLQIRDLGFNSEVLLLQCGNCGPLLAGCIEFEDKASQLGANWEPGAEP